MDTAARPAGQPRRTRRPPARAGAAAARAGARPWRRWRRCRRQRLGRRPARRQRRGRRVGAGPVAPPPRLRPRACRDRRTRDGAGSEHGRRTGRRAVPGRRPRVRRTPGRPLRARDGRLRQRRPAAGLAGLPGTLGPRQQRRVAQPGGDGGPRRDRAAPPCPGPGTADAGGLRRRRRTVAPAAATRQPRRSRHAAAAAAPARAAAARGARRGGTGRFAVGLVAGAAGRRGRRGRRRGSTPREPGGAARWSSAPARATATPAWRWGGTTRPATVSRATTPRPCAGGRKRPNKACRRRSSTWA